MRTKMKFSARWVLLIILFPLSLYGQDQRALLVAIDNYPQGSGWEKIHGVNDATLIENLLVSSGFVPDYIKKLYNAQATKENIVGALERLLHESQLGDFIHIHFSCHGQQMMDDNGDEEDGLDEALIPYDAQFWYTPGVYEGESHLRDDELGLWIKRIREKIGAEGQLTLTLDACHSGTANRVYGDDDYIRGTGYIFAPKDFTPTPGEYLYLSLHLKDEPNLASVCVFSACLPEEINYEYYCKEQLMYFGRLTYSLVKSLQATEKELSFEELFSRMQKYNDELTKNRRKKQHFYFESSDKRTTIRLKMQNER